MNKKPWYFKNKRWYINRGARPTAPEGFSVRRHFGRGVIPLNPELISFEHLPQDFEGDMPVVTVVTGNDLFREYGRKKYSLNALVLDFYLSNPILLIRQMRDWRNVLFLNTTYRLISWGEDSPDYVRYFERTGIDTGTSGIVPLSRSFTNYEWCIARYPEDGQSRII